jgi:O-antigen/teichoic acid export membrane protein
LTKDQIRLRYSGFVIFAVKMFSVVTGLIFQLMIARATTSLEYGIWFNVNDVLSYFTLLAGVLPFWTMRFVARGREGTIKTGILANLTLSVISAFIYLLFVPTITSALGISQKYVLLYFLVLFQIINLYSINVLEACLQAKMPQAIGYGLLIEESCKVVLGYVLIIVFQQPLLGALLSLLTAITIQVVYYLKILAGELKQRVRWEYVREWLKGSVINIYNVLGNQVTAFILIMLFAYGGEEARGYYGAAAQIATVISYSTSLAFALYPRLLTEKNGADVTTSLKMVLMFAIPAFAGAIAMPDSYLSMLSVVYKEAAPVLLVLAVDALVGTMLGVLTNVVYGFERFDEKAKISFRELVRSRLFIAFSLPYLQSAITLPMGFYILTTHTPNNPLESATYVGILNLSAHLVIFLLLYAIVRKAIMIRIPWENIMRYILASAVMATVLLIIPHPTRLYSTLAVTAMGGAIYLALLMMIDKETRSIINLAWREIMSALNRFAHL